MAINGSGVKLFIQLIKQNQSLNTRIFRIITGAFLILLTYSSVSDYLTSVRLAEDLVLQKLQGIVNNLSVQIDGDQHLELTNSYDKRNSITVSNQDANYLFIHQLLQTAYTTHNLNTPIYTFIKSASQDHHFDFVVTSSEVPYYRHLYNSFPIKHLPIQEKGATMGVYKSNFGNWLSAYAPIYNKAGQIVGYVQADEKFDNFISIVRGKTIRNTVFSFLGFFLIIVFLLPHLQQILQEEAKQKALLANTLVEAKTLSKEVEESRRQLNEYAQQLEASNKDLTDFAHIASHDLKSPIRNIQSFAQLLKMKKSDKLDERGQEFLDFIISSADKAQQLVDGLLRYSTADKDLGKQIQFPIHHAIEQAQKNLHEIIRDKNARLLFSEMPLIKANPTLIAQVWQNLINNAIKYNQSKQTIIEIGTAVGAKNGRYYYIKDNGIGIPADRQEAVFKMFTRLHAGQEYEGSGIGLAFCKRVVTSYGGKMWIESKEGKGTTFFFTLPNAVPEIDQKSKQLVMEMGN